MGCNIALTQLTDETSCRATCGPPCGAAQLSDSFHRGFTLVEYQYSILQIIDEYQYSILQMTQSIESYGFVYMHMSIIIHAVFLMQ